MTDIPHFSFSHHRVGIHAEKSSKLKYTESDELVAVADVSHLPELERLRLLGLAYDVFAGKLAGGMDDESRDDPSYRALADVFSRRGRRILEGVREQGLIDAETEDFFSRFYWRKKPALCIEHAELALKSKHISPETRQSALFHLATTHFDHGRLERSFPYLEKLVKMERNEISFMLLAICHQRKGDLSEAVRLIQQAILADPTRADLHSFLASVYRQMGKSKEVEKHLNRAELLHNTVPQPK